MTGAGSGIGLELTRHLLDRGYAVAAWDVSPAALEAVPQERLDIRQIDVRDGEAMKAAVAEIGAAGSHVAGLVACAAVYRAVPFLQLDEATWDDCFAVNLTGGLLACQAVLPLLRRQRAGSIVLFSSTIARSGAVGGAHYAATKGGILGLMRSLALEVARENIRVNCVSPGLTDTPQPRGNMSESDMFAKAADVPLGRIGTAADMAEAALFLLEPDSSFVTGQDIRVNGGARLF